MSSIGELTTAAVFVLLAVLGLSAGALGVAWAVAHAAGIGLAVVLIVAAVERVTHKRQLAATRPLCR